MKVSFVDLGKQYTDIVEEATRMFSNAVSKGLFMGAQSFEKKFADFHGRKHCVGVGSGTDALILALQAFGIGPGDEVIVPANTYIATAFAVSHVGAKPVFIDPDPNSYVITVEGIEKALTAKTKAVIPVHLYGHPADMKEIMVFAAKNNLIVIEDCAQSAGAEVDSKMTGSWGHAGCFSFYPTKNLGGLAQGGAVLLDNDKAAVKVRELGNVGRADGSWYDYIHVGYNSRLDAINATFLELCLEKLPRWNNNRQFIAGLYSMELGAVEEVVLPLLPGENISPVFHLYEIKCRSKEERDGLKDYLSSKDIGCGLHYPIPCHKQPMYEQDKAFCPAAENLADTLLSLPMHPNLSSGEIKYVCDNIKSFFRK